MTSRTARSTYCTADALLFALLVLRLHRASRHRRTVLRAEARSTATCGNILVTYIYENSSLAYDLHTVRFMMGILSGPRPGPVRALMPVFHAVPTVFN